ncbi:MAG: dihydroneopterin aldolase [Deltaproteobacteria bacterium]
MDVIRIHRLELDCIVGIRPPEREHQQRVRLDLGLHADVSQAGRTGRISLTADYDQVAHEVAALLSFRRYHLIEMAAEEVAAMLLGVHASVQRVDVRIEKPAALAGRARAASVEVKRRRRDFPRSVEREPHGAREVLLDTREARLELVRIDPEQELGEAPESKAEALYWLLSGAATAEQGPLSPRLPEGASHSSSDSPSRLRSLGPDPAVLFRCWRRNLTAH